MDNIVTLFEEARLSETVSKADLARELSAMSGRKISPTRFCKWRREVEPIPFYVYNYMLADVLAYWYGKREGTKMAALIKLPECGRS